MKNLKRLIAACMMLIIMGLSVVPSTAVIMQDQSGKTVELPEFQDTKGHWAEQAINQWQYYKVISGNKGKFYPNDPLTRRDFAVIVNNLFKYSDIAVNSFKDLELNQYYTVPMLKLNAAGVLFGNAGAIRPHDRITRQEAVAVICRAFKIDSEEGTTTFKDDSKISPWAYPQVKAMQRYKYIVGGPDGNFNPNGYLTRAQIITILNNIVTAYYNENGKYTNEYLGNGFVNTSGVTIERSNIVGNLYISPGIKRGETIIDATEIKGTLVHMGTKSSLKLRNETTIDKIDLRAPEITVSGAGNVKEIYVSSEAKTATITGIPDKLTLEAGCSAKIDDTEFINEGEDKITYNRDIIEGEVAGSKGFITGGPQIKSGKITIDINNTVVLNDISVVTRGDSEITEVGIIYNKSADVPTLNKYGVKDIFEGNSADYASFYMAVRGQSPGEVWTYRAYVKNKNGKVGYSSPLSIKAYSYDVTCNVLETKYEYDSLGAVSAILKKCEVFVHGSNVPDVKGAVILSNLNNGIEEAYKETKAKLTTSNITSLYKKLSYTETLRFVPDEGVIQPHKYFGCRVIFGESIGEKEKFPTYTDNTKIAQDVDSIITGSARYIGDTRILFENNRFTEGSGAIVETGIVVLETSKGTAAPKTVQSGYNWQRYKYYTGSGVLHNDFNVEISVTASSSKAYHYAAYVKTTTQTTYGEIKTVTPPTSPVYNGVKSITLGTYKTNAVVELNVTSSLNINMTGSDGLYHFENLTEGKYIYKYHREPLNVANAVFKDNVLTLTFTGLEPNKQYKVGVKLGNSKGVAAVEYFTIDTSGKK